MDDVKKMLRTIVNGQSAMKQELLSKIDSLDKKVEKGFTGVNKRLDTIGKSVAYLEDDAPTIGEFDKLEKRVSKLENRAIKN
ncbi:hypothetical protein A2955_01505 [Candidatus Woesebacteria bacterium RIFCSPLOWO2_01_FULL_37_19]|uniref:Uncharacterized protein n=1 Tax=Candidatus Woesebacteria bacterium RIFCSPLOWO2_01_FULL_37_19 TaxID=1802514 RepID=A0A1F8B9L6_9BACT|nr:MAG: hypothetical protein A2955_01505 [Candidatus Woesebacteria bacterium RIFCSPLOWO2_01_FULL_37_19]